MLAAHSTCCCVCNVEVVVTRSSRPPAAACVSLLSLYFIEKPSPPWLRCRWPSPAAAENLRWNYRRLMTINKYIPWSLELSSLKVIVTQNKEKKSLCSQWTMLLSKEELSLYLSSYFSNSIITEHFLVNFISYHNHPTNSFLRFRLSLSNTSHPIMVRCQLTKKSKRRIPLCRFNRRFELRLLQIAYCLLKGLKKLQLKLLCLNSLQKIFEFFVTKKSGWKVVSSAGLDLFAC